MSCKKACSCICTSSDMKSLEQLNQRLVNLESGERFQESSLRDRRDWVFCMHFLLYQCILHGEPNFRGTALRIFFLGGRRGGNDTHELCFSGILLTSFRHSYFYQKAIKILHYMLCCQWIFKKEKKKKSHTYEQISWETIPLCPLLRKTSLKKCSNIWLNICVL